jgi:hypothetical protein
MVLTFVGVGLIWLGASLGALLVPTCADLSGKILPPACRGPLYYTLGAYVFIAAAAFSLVKGIVRRRRV